MRKTASITVLSCVLGLSGCGWVSRHMPGDHGQTESAVETKVDAAAAPVAASETTTVPSSSESKPTAPVPRPNVINHEATGNLAAKFDLACVGAENLENRYTPADLYPAMTKCLSQSDYKKAVFISALAGVYARFDTLRVADKTAHDANAVLRMQATANVSDEQKKTFRKTMQDITGNPADFAQMCRDIAHIGPPSYFPDYMIQHGMAAFDQNGGSVLVPDFNIADGWQTSLDSYLHCPK